MITNEGGGNQFSLFQTWVMRGTRNRDNPQLDTQQRIEIGWQKWGNNIYPELFLYTKVSLYPTVNKCYEPCGNYVQYSPSTAPGSVVNSISIPYGTQYYTRIEVRLYNGVWWLRVKGEWMGYYPAGTFNFSSLGHHADEIWWGGEGTNTRSSTTESDMGSGHLASQGYPIAAWMRNMKQRVYPGEQDYVVDWIGDVAGCSTGEEGSMSGWGTHVFLGGPNAPASTCP